MTNPITCIYHGNGCLDGFAAAWSLRQFLPNTTFIAANYGDSPPALDPDCTLYIVDFSYEPEVIVALSKQVRKLILIDHHKTAILKLATYFNLPLIESDDAKYGRQYFYAGQQICGLNIDLYLNTNESGAMLTYRHFSTGLPNVVTFVGDRDLWRFQRQETKAYCRYLMSQPYSFEAWDHVDTMAVDDVVRVGDILLADDDLKIQWHLDTTVRFVDMWSTLQQSGFQDLIGVGYHQIPFVDVPRYVLSETLSRLVDDHPFAMGYHDTATHRVIRFNSCRGGVDVSQLAEAFGGGGHATAASASVSRDHILAQL